jgi:hypothetical protein
MPKILVKMPMADKARWKNDLSKAPDPVVESIRHQIQHLPGISVLAKVVEIKSMMSKSKVMKFS